MKNFPHQFNNIGKLTTALSIMHNLNAQGANVNDDGVFGTELAKLNVYTFRNLITSIDERLKIEREKQISNQGFRTAARDIRRFFNISGLINEANELTEKGREIVDSTVNSGLNLALWRDAMLQTCLVDLEGNMSHPYRILLRLVGEFPDIETAKLLLALVAKNDSEDEFKRISSLVYMPLDEIEETLGITSTSARNAVKILPAIAEQVGDITRESGRSHLITSYSASEDELYIANSPVTKIDKGLSPINPEDIAKSPNFTASKPAEFDLSAGIAIRQKRTIRHHATVLNFANLLGLSGFQIYEHPFDCLGFKGDVGAILSEIKTLDGSKTDERKQSIRALGQLKGYEFFHVPADLKQPKLIQLIAFDNTPSQETINFGAHNEVQITWLEGDQWLTVDDGNTSKFDPDVLFE